jgi:hypothetical protein
MITIITTLLKEVILWIIGTTFKEKILKGKDMLINPLYKYGAIAAVALALGFGAWSWHTTQVQKAVNAATAVLDQEYRVAIDEQRKRLVARSEASQRDMQKALTNSQRNKDAEIKKSKSELADLRRSVQQRPSSTDSPSGDPDSTAKAGSPQGATGLQLYSDHAEFLAGYAGITTELQSELKSCIEDYDNMRNELIDYVSK